MRPLERSSGPSREAPADDIRQRLRDLPSDSRPPYDWAEFRRRERGRDTSRYTVKWEHAAAAAGITVLIASMAMWVRSDQQLAQVAAGGVATAPLSAANDVTAAARAPGQADGGSLVPQRAGSSDDLDARANAIARIRTAEASRAAQAAVASQFAAFAGAPASERWLEQHSVEPALVRVGPRLAVANLEDRIAWVDDALTDAQFTPASAAGLRALQQERARLISSLAQVRYAETLVAQVP
jgi:hypothetical protein